jgi:hypothetical protein
MFVFYVIVGLWVVTASIINAQDGGGMFLQNMVSTYKATEL